MNIINTTQKTGFKCSYDINEELSHVFCTELAKQQGLKGVTTETGYFDMMSYQKYNDGVMKDYIPTDAEIKPTI